MTTVDNHFDKWVRGLDLNYYETNTDLARAAFAAGFEKALGDRDAIAGALGNKLDAMRPGLRAKAEKLARGEMKRH